MRICTGTDKTDPTDRGYDVGGPYYKWNGGMYSPMHNGSTVAVMYKNENNPIIAFQSEVDWERVSEFCILTGETKGGVVLQRSENQYGYKGA